MKVDLDEAELAYLSRAVFRQRVDAPDDEPELAARLDPKISVARIRARDGEDGGSSIDHVIVYVDAEGGYRWRAVAGNNEIVATGESHTRPEDAARAARGVLGHDVDVRIP